MTNDFRDPQFQKGCEFAKQQILNWVDEKIKDWSGLASDKEISPMTQAMCRCFSEFFEAVEQEIHELTFDLEEYAIAQDRLKELEAQEKMKLREMFFCQIGHILRELAFKTDCWGPFKYAYRAGCWCYGEADKACKSQK